MVPDLAVDYRDGGTDRCREYAGSDHGGGICASILAPVGDDGNGNELEGGNVEDQKGAHLIAGDAFPSFGEVAGILALYLQMGQFFHGLQAGGSAGPAKTEDIGDDICGYVLPGRMIFGDKREKESDKAVSYTHLTLPTT